MSNQKYTYAELLRQDEDWLFEQYLASPTLSNMLDMQRFLAWAIVANHNNTGFTGERENRLRDKGLDERQIDKLWFAYSLATDIEDMLIPER